MGFPSVFLFLYKKKNHKVYIEEFFYQDFLPYTNKNQRSFYLHGLVFHIVLRTTVFHPILLLTFFFFFFFFFLLNKALLVIVWNNSDIIIAWNINQDRKSIDFDSLGQKILENFFSSI